MTASQGSVWAIAVCCLSTFSRFIEAHRRYAELLRILANPTVQSVTLITSRERLYEDGISVWLYPLRELPEEAWNQFFETCGINTGSSPLSDASALYQMHQAYGGNAEAMFVLNGAIQIECQGDLEAYWEENHEDLLINPTLENLVKSQFNKLQQDNEQAYRLLCRLGCYRYQDVPSVPKEGIFYLLWDVPEERRKRVVKALRDRSLVKVCNEEYYLHPVIRAEAIARLRASEDWERTNREAARFWTGSINTVETPEDAFKAFEAYYYYLEISDFKQAADVILKRRDNKAFLCWLINKESVHTQKLAVGALPSQRFRPYIIYSIAGLLYKNLGRVFKPLDPPQPSFKRGENLLKVPLLKGDLGGSSVP